MPLALVASTSDGLGQNGGASSAIDTTGANLLVLVASWYAGVGNPTISDSKGNSWTPLTQQDGAAPGFASVRMYYSVPSSVGSGHTFSLTGADTYCTISVDAFSGAHASPYTSQENGSASGGVQQAAGSVTPSEDNCVVVTGLAAPEALGAVPSVSGYTADATNYIAATAMAGGIAYQIQTTATATNPLWTWTGSPDTGAAAVVAVFKAAAGGGGGGSTARRATRGLMGVGA
jgi:hypothetical protein